MPAAQTKSVPSAAVVLHGNPVLRASRVGTADSYYGFDKNDYPGDNLLPALHRHFAYAGYWLNNPPGASRTAGPANATTLKANGFGFMILYNGRLDAELKGKDAAALGRSDAAAAISAAKREGFGTGAILFLDQEEGGRLLPEQSAYLFAWIVGIGRSQYRPGVYCSGILVPDGSSQISTARDILSHDGKLALWVANDQCPPSAGLRAPAETAGGSFERNSAGTGLAVCTVATEAVCPACAATYATDSNCYAPGLPAQRADVSGLERIGVSGPIYGR